MTKLERLREAALGAVECWPEDCEAFLRELDPQTILALLDAVEALRKIQHMADEWSYREADGSETISASRTSEIANAALAALDALEEPI